MPASAAMKAKCAKIGWLARAPSPIVLPLGFYRNSLTHTQRRSIRRHARHKPGHDDRTNQFGWNLLYTATECRFWLAGR
jgi:hypothetical protein